MTRIYIDGVFDVFHIGHIDCFRKAKNFRKNATLIVGIISDQDAKNYKREPIYKENDRYTIVNSLRIVDEVIYPAPLVMTKEFVTRHNIDIVLHGFSDISDYKKQEKFYEQVKSHVLKTKF